MYTEGSAPPEQPWTPSEDWRNDKRFLFAADLFDHRYMWEAHEAWEALWHFADENSAERALLQSLICCAASSLKHHMGTPSSASKLLRRATSILRPWSSSRVIYGVVHGSVLTATAEHLKGGSWPTLTLENP